MNKPRKTPVPLPGAKRKSAVPLPKNNLSKEWVDSSDDSSNENPPAPKTTKDKRNISTTIAVHRPKTNGLAKSTTKSLKEQSKTAKAASKPSAPTKKPEPKVAVEERSAESSSSSEESSNESEVVAKTSLKKAGAKKQADAVEISSDSESSSEESEDETTSAAPSEAAPSHSTPAKKQSHTVEFQPRRPYVPPKDFNLVSTIRASSSAPTTIFDKLEGKQIWHITAPMGVSLEGLKELAVEQALNGEAILQHRGVDYGFSTVETEDSDVREVMIPRQKGFSAVSARISQTLHVQEVVSLPNLSSKQADPNTGSEAAASITKSTIRAPRPQVKGLKMRFFPSGAGRQEPISLGASDDEDEAKATSSAVLDMPNGIHLSSKPEKRKHRHTNGDERIESPTKKHKKHLTPEELKRKEEKKAKKERKKQKG